MVNLTAGGISGGYAKYLRSLVPRLARDPSIETLRVFGPPRAAAVLDIAGGIVSAWPSDDLAKGFPWLKGTVRDLEPDVVFIPTASWVDFGRPPVVVMVRNMEPLEAPFGGNPPREVVRNLARRAMARRSCRRARRVIAVSDHVRTFLVSKWRIDPARVPVVHHGIDAPQTIAGDAAPGPLQSVSPLQFLFTAGSVRPARGLIDLIRTLPQLCGPGHPVTLVIAGATDDGMERHRQDLVRHAERLGVGSRIVWSGPLDDVAMGWCYRNCAAFVMTSRAEACPNVALEAMSYGCACVSVDRAPMPEFFGEAAAYYQPGDAISLARAIESALEPPRRSSLAAAARARARQFDWDATARKTAAELRAAVHP